MSITDIDSLMKTSNIRSHAFSNNNTEDDDLYSGYDSVPPDNINDLVEDEEFQEALRTVTWGKRSATPKPPGTALRIATSYSRLGTGIDPRPKTGRLNLNSAIRPPTAIKGAGYSSGSKLYDPYNKSPKALGILSETPKDETPAMKFKNMERKIIALLEECYKTCATKPKSAYKSKGNSSPVLPDYTATLAKAREASTLERALIRMQEEIGHKEHNFDLTYAVLYNMAMQYSFNEMYEEALNAYTLMTKNKLFANSNRLKLNIGNIYYKTRQYKKAIKLYHMALDQVPSTQRELRLKIMHNLAATFVTIGQYQEAAINFEYIMSEKGDIKSGLRLVLCYYALEDVGKMKMAFKKLLNVDLDLLDTDSYIDPIVDPDLTILKDVILSDEMSQIEQRLKCEAEQCILVAAKVIAPVIEDSYIDGYNWCVDSLKESYYGILANELEMNNAVTFLKRNDVAHAIETLKIFERKEDKVAYTASVNLSFVYYLQGNYEAAAKYTAQAKKLDSYNSAAYVNQGALYFNQGKLPDAKEEFQTALSNDAGCVEAIYNLGLLHKIEGEYDVALDFFRRLEVLYGSDPIPPLLYQLGHLYEMKNDSDAANECYMQVLGLDPTDPSVLKRMGEMFAKDNDKQQAFNYMTDSYRYYSGNLDVINWLGSYHIEEQQGERAHLYFERAAMASPNVAKWYLLSASCYKKTGNYQQALAMYTDIHKNFPENVECLKCLIEMCTKQGLKEAELYAAELKRVEKSKEARERIGSARPGSRRTALSMAGHTISVDNPRFGNESALSSRGSLRSSGRYNAEVSRGVQHAAGERLATADAQKGLNNIDYDDPLGSPPNRPRTVVKFGIGDTFKNQDLGEDLLPS